MAKPLRRLLAPILVPLTASELEDLFDEDGGDVGGAGFIGEIPLEAAVTINPSSGSIFAETGTRWFVECWDEPGDGGIRFKYPLASLTPGLYRFTAEILWVDLYGGSENAAYVDFRDQPDEGVPCGPMPGTIDVTRRVDSWDTVFRFIDVWMDPNYDTVNIAEFRINDPHLFRIGA